jgi:predicted ATPase/class 3 adenylate cyclase
MGLVAFLFTDIEGSTALLQRSGERVYAELLAEHHTIIRTALAAHHGQEVDTQGDGFFALFSSARECVAAVLQMQHALAERNWPGAEEVRVRMGVHTGEAAWTPAGLVGLDVHRAARIAAVGHGGQVLLSEASATLVRDALPADAGLRDLGVHRLKDLGRPEHIFQLLAAGLQADFPPLRSLSNPRLLHNLPAQLTDFVGRGSELAEIRKLLKSSRLVTLTGAGGAGKTRLALQIAAEILDGSDDGVWLVELATVTNPGEVASAIGAALRIPVQPTRAVDSLADALEPQDILIVLDNCEHLIDGCAKIVDALLRRCPRLHVLATSREPLGIGGEVVYRVPSLSLPDRDDLTGPLQSFDAVALFAARAAAQGVELALDGDGGHLVVSVCRRLDGMPLAIELAAARLRSMSLSTLRDRLDDRFRLLTGGSRVALERQQTLRATVSWSYDLLTTSEKILLRRLSVFADSFDLDAAEQVCGRGNLPADQVAELIGSLVDKSLVMADADASAQTSRYQLLETIRQFAAEQLSGLSGEEAASIAAGHRDHFLSLAEMAAPHLTGPDQGAWFARLDADEPNLRLAADRAAADPDGTSLVLRFGVALWRYRSPLTGRFRAEDANRLLAALARPQARAEPRLFAAALAAGTNAALSADPAASRQVGEQAVQAARQVDDGRVLVHALVMLGTIYFHAGERERGLPLGREAVDRARELGDDALLSWGLATCLLFAKLIDPAEVQELFAEAMACIERAGDPMIKYNLLANASNRALGGGDIAAARGYVEQALLTMQNVWLVANYDMLIQMAWVLRAEQNPAQAEQNLAQARQMLEAALRNSRRTGRRLGIAYAILGMALLAGDARDWTLAAQLHGAAQNALDPTGLPWQELENGYRQQSLPQLRAELGDEIFDRAYARGVALSFDAAFDLAIGRAQRRLPVLRGRPGTVVDRAGHLRRLEDGLDGDPARALQDQPGGLGLPSRRAEPVLAARVLEVQVHADRAVLPDQAARLDQDLLAVPQVADEDVARRVQQQQARPVVRGEHVHGLADRVVVFGVVTVQRREPDARRLPLVADVAGGDEEAVLDHVHGLVGRQRDGERLTGMIGTDRQVPGTVGRHHEQRHPGQHPVPAARHAHAVQLDGGVAVQQHVVGEVDGVLLV